MHALTDSAGQYYKMENTWNLLYVVKCNTWVRREWKPLRIRAHNFVRRKQVNEEVTNILSTPYASQSTDKPALTTAPGLVWLSPDCITKCVWVLLAIRW